MTMHWATIELGSHVDGDNLLTTDNEGRAVTAKSESDCPIKLKAITAGEEGDLCNVLILTQPVLFMNVFAHANIHTGRFLSWVDGCTFVREARTGDKIAGISTMAKRMVPQQDIPESELAAAEGELLKAIIFEGHFTVATPAKDSDH